MHSYSLFELNEYIKRVIALNFAEPVWVNAEIAQVRESRGQVYVELVQHEENSDQITAQISAVIWYKSYLFIKKKLNDLLSSVLREGSQVLIKVSVEYHERYGLKLNIVDIDASYTIGQMEMARQKIIERLNKEGIVDLNKSKSLPTVIQRVAIISSENAAGYQDFREQLQSNNFGYAFHAHLFHAAMQGQNVEREVVSALKKIGQKQYDCIVIIRGGGSRLDLSYFDNYNIAHAIAMSDIPIISGIGHDIDQSVTDLVAFLALKTPTAVADHILEHNLLFESSLTQKGNWINNMSKQLVINHKLHLSTLHQILDIKPREMIRRMEEYLNRIDKEINISSKNKTTYQARLLDNMDNIITITDPVNVIKKGYAMIEHNGKILTKAEQLIKGQEISISMKDGKKKAEIK